MRASMLCSTIIPTIGRPTLSRAVCSVLDQEFEMEDFEVIVVNDSGKPLAEEAWMRSQRIKILHTNRHNRSVARNTGAAVARGRYLHFLDDDDWILPGAFHHLWQHANSCQAGWVYGSFQLVDNQGELIKEIHPSETGNCFIQMIASEWIPLQASWIDSQAFFTVGGFASLASLEGGYEDIDLSRLVAGLFDFARAPGTIAVIRTGDTGSTTDYNNLVRQNRRSREKSLDAPGTFTRLRASAQAACENAGYWHGRIAYYYLVSIPWNLKQKRPLKAASRMAYALATFATAGIRIISPKFWRGVSQPHHNLVRVSLQDSEARLYHQTVWKR